MEKGGHSPPRVLYLGFPPSLGAGALPKRARSTAQGWGALSSVTDGDCFGSLSALPISCHPSGCLENLGGFCCPSRQQPDKQSLPPGTANNTGLFSQHEREG